MSSAPVSLAFTEDMHGFCHFDGNNQDFGRDDQQCYEHAFQQGQSQGRAVKFRLTIQIPDIDRFVKDPKLCAEAIGKVEADAAGGDLKVEKGTFNLFVQPASDQASTIAREMHYTLYLRNQKGEPWTFYGYKTVRDGAMAEVWDQTTTLYTRLWKGHSDKAPDKVEAQGILHLTAEDFARQLTTFRSSGRTILERARALTLFGGEFMGNLWQSYAPGFMQSEPELWSKVAIPVHTDRGVSEATITHHPFDTRDGLTLGLQRFQRKPSDDVIVILHGLTTSTDMFIMPEHQNLVEYLLDEGYGDVWSLDWRGSGRYTYNLEPHSFTLDDVAAYDIPPALEKIRAAVGPKARLHIIAHCVGGISTMLSMALQSFPGLESVTINSVGLTPRVSTWSRLKLMFAPFLVEKVLRYPYVSPRMPQYPGLALGKWLVPVLALFHRECRDPACHFISFMWGSGHPAAYQHSNMSVLTHSRLADLFGGTSMNYYRHISKMVGNGQACPMKPGARGDLTLPGSYLDAFCQKKQPRLLLISGRENHIFPGANRVLYEELKKRRADLAVRYWEVPGYGHQDIFMGQHAARDIFPGLLAFLQGKEAGV
ncbi:alpha/beta fold hydrolase [Oligoflexus tunisiensis]|uniref:alpha/beta fold hydrolase n=1 Tax=Oligoflexus tunisiensis TaxID=708132 RepID=UPI001C405771|nr:alpha/beta fold hydrolase [Oligoflexus tunisiensis]